MGRTVVVKVIRRSLTEEDAVVRRFEREARIVARLDHPNIVKVFTAGETEEGAHYVVMEYAEGPTLHEEIHRVGRVDEVRAARIGAQICGALAAAHAAGIVHRDLKPANVILTSLPGGEDRVRVLDFGIAKLSGQEGGSALTALGAILGTPAYMSPEQVGGGKIDGRSDLYTLGVMLYEMVTGKHPNDAATPVQCIVQHLQEPMTPPQIWSPGLELTDSFRDVLIRSCAKDPTARFVSAEAMQNALRRAADRLAQLTDSATIQVVPSPLSTFGDRLTIAAPEIAPSPAHFAPPAAPSAARIVLRVVVAMLLAVAGAAAAISFVLSPNPGDGKPVFAPESSEATERYEAVNPSAPPSPHVIRSATAAPPSQPRLRTAAAETTPPAAFGTASGSPQAVPTIVPRPIPPSEPKPSVARAPSPAISVARPPSLSRPALPLAEPSQPEEFRFAFNEARGFPLPARTRVRMDTGGLLSTETPSELEAVVEFLHEEFDDVSMVNDNLDEGEPWFGLMFDDGPFTMVRAEKEGAGTRIDYFLNPNHES
ncbi:MAG: serine/threonine-protein kinase [Bradymonadia bacterium]